MKHIYESIVFVRFRKNEYYDWADIQRAKQNYSCRVYLNEKNGY